MTSPEHGQVGAADEEPDVDPPAGPRRAVAIAGGLGVAVAAALVVVALAMSNSSATTGTAAPATSTPATSTPATQTPAPAVTAKPTVAPSSAGEPTPVLAGKKDVPPAMSDAQMTTTRAELTALAARLPANLALTAPATWAQWAGQTPSYDDDIVSCPHIADTLAADLGERWTYTFGKLPQGPFGCNWTPVPWVPDVSRFFVSIGYQTGRVPDLLQGMDYCAGGVEAPRVDVDAVRHGAVLYGCDDANGAGYDLAVPDTGGAGAFFLHATGGAEQTPSQVADAMLAVIDGATRNYG